MKAARLAKRRVHILHVTAPQELAFLAANKDIASVELTPQHLTMAGEEACPRLGRLAQMNPPIRSPHRHNYPRQDSHVGKHAGPKGLRRAIAVHGRPCGPAGRARGE